MKKIFYLISLLALTLITTPNIASAHYYGEGNPDNCNIGIRVEASKDNGVTWYSYDSSDAASLGNGYILSVSPGDTIKMRIKLWNDGNNSCLVSATGTNTGFENLGGLSGTFDNLDEDGDTTSVLPAPEGISSIMVPVGNSTASSGYQSVSLNATVKSDAPEDASVTLNYSVGQALGGPMSVGSSNKSFTQKIVDALIPTAHADDDGTAISGLRVEVNTPVTETSPAVTELPKTGGDAYLVIIPALLLAPTYLLIIKRRKMTKG